MISVEEASKIISDHAQDYGIEKVSLENSLGRVLREPISADRDFPPFDRVAMDGIAIKYDDFLKGKRYFQIKGVAAAGAPQLELKEEKKEETCCFEIMTGAILPIGLDTVIRYEDLEVSDGVAKVIIDEVKPKQNIHFKGMDRKKDEVIIAPNKRISSAEISVSATVGKSEIKVSKLPKALIISTGDELVTIDQKPAPHQIRMSNVHTLKALLKDFQIDAHLAHLNDTYEVIVEKIDQFLSDYDFIILSGGVSKGKFDYVPKALEELGVKKHFHRVAQRPGKPFWFGSKDEKVVFALPGNPASSFVCMLKYIRPWVKNSIQLEDSSLPKAILDEEVIFKPDLTYFLEVKISFNANGQLVAKPVRGNGSGDLANLVDADAFIELPAGQIKYEKGAIYDVLNYR